MLWFGSDEMPIGASGGIAAECPRANRVLGTPEGFDPQKSQL